MKILTKLAILVCMFLGSSMLFYSGFLLTFSEDTKAVQSMAIMLARPL